MELTKEISRIRLIGDVHSEHSRLSTALEWFSTQNVDALLCTGDIADGEGDINTSCQLLAESNVYVVRGNHDRWLLAETYRNIPNAHSVKEVSRSSLDFLESLDSFLEFQTPLGRLLLCHGVGKNDLAKIWPGSPRRKEPERSQELDDLLLENKYTFLINGHSHYRIIVDFPSLTLINAGTLVSRHRPGISILDFNTKRIKSFEFNETSIVGPVANCELLPGETRQIWKNTQAFDGSSQPFALYDQFDID